MTGNIRAPSAINYPQLKQPNTPQCLLFMKTVHYRIKPSISEPGLVSKTASLMSKTAIIVFNTASSVSKSDASKVGHALGKFINYVSHIWGGLDPPLCQ